MVKPENRLNAYTARSSRANYCVLILFLCVRVLFVCKLLLALFSNFLIVAQYRY